MFHIFGNTKRININMYIKKFKLIITTFKTMMNNSSKERLRLAHEVLDKQLSNSSFGRSSLTKQSDVGRSKNVQSEISELERKLLDLEKKMENIDVSSSNDEDDKIANIIGKSSRNSKTALDHHQNSKQKVRNLSKNSKLSAQKQQFPGSESDEQDSGDDTQIYAKILQDKKGIPHNVQTNKRDYRKQYLEQKEPKITINKQPITRPLQNNAFNVMPKKQQRQNSKKQTIITQPKSKDLKDLRNSVKSVKSNKSRKSNHSIASKGSKSNLRKSSSKKSIRSVQKGGLTAEQLRQIQLQNTKDLKKISNLQKQLNHYKRLCQKQQQKLEQYRIMEIEFKKLQTNFSKSEQIRKQQKKIIQNLKTKN